MESLTRHFYELQFDLRVRTAHGEAFQDFFSDAMELRYPGDFQRVRPWGKLGDRKCDGYLKSKRQLFQVYGPKGIELAKTLAKITDDFLEAKPFWKEHFDLWTFVHNDPDGVAADVLKHLLGLQAAHPPITTGQWGIPDLRAVVFALADSHIARLLGPPVSVRDVQNVEVKDLQPILTRIAKQDALPEADIRPVPSGKLTANLLSDGVAMLLRAGMGKSDLVKKCFDHHTDPMLGDRVAATFHAKYDALKTEGLLPDVIFRELMVFTTGSPFLGTPDHQAACLAVLAYLFESCDIFERPPTSGDGA